MTAERRRVVLAARDALGLALRTEEPDDCRRAARRLTKVEAIRGADETMVLWAREAMADLTWVLASPARRDGPWRLEPLPSTNRRIQAMTSPEQRCYYTWLARTCAEVGCVVELGSWMGAVTVCLAAGASATLGARAAIHTFDGFCWEAWMDEYVNDDTLNFRAGDDFFDLFWENCGPYRHMVIPHRSCLGDADVFGGAPPMSWDGVPIGILVNDLWDDYDVCSQVWSVFAPALVPGRSVVVMNQYGLPRSAGLRRFCRECSDQLVPHHKPVGPTKAFLFMGTDS